LQHPHEASDSTLLVSVSGPCECLLPTPQSGGAGARARAHTHTLF
jgi:hypothetical protein